METVPKIQKRPVPAADRKCKKQKRKGIKYMEIRILTVGKIKEKYLSDGIAEYAKRLGRYCKLSFFQVPDEKTPDKASDALNIQIM